MNPPVPEKSRTPSGAPGPARAIRDGWLVWLLVASLVGAILQITFGGVVRVTESGDGCPDWPLCYGRLIPPVDKHALIEWTHRSAGMLVGLAILAATVRAWTKAGNDVRAVWLTSASLALIAIVGGIGGAVVLSDLNPAIRTLHLAMAETVSSRQRGRETDPPAPGREQGTDSLHNWLPGPRLQRWRQFLPDPTPYGAAQARCVLRGRSAEGRSSRSRNWRGYTCSTASSRWRLRSWSLRRH